MFSNTHSEKSPESAGGRRQINRQPCVAGQFYPGDAGALQAALGELFAKAKPPGRRRPQAIIVPHAGYVFSGEVAAAAFNQLDPLETFEHIFLIGSSHRAYFDGASVYNRGNYVTPLGEVKVDTALATQLIDDHDFFKYSREADAHEHSLEVQLPFLQYHLQHDFRIVPVVIATQSHDTISAIAAALKPWFNKKNLFVISTDFSHYPPYADACKVDEITAAAIAANSPEKFLTSVKKSEQAGVPNLATAICGWSSVLALLNITSSLNEIDVVPLEYRNSGDAAYGDRDRVVGYWAMGVYHSATDQSLNFSQADKNELLTIARKAIHNHLQPDAGRLGTHQSSEKLNLKFGAFVSVYVDDKLRGCIGRFEPELPLHLLVEELAVSAATGDRRFDPVRADELDGLSIEISVLSPLKLVNSIDEIVPGKHGIYLKKGMHSGAFLPQVAAKNNWDVETFLSHCAAEKAGIGRDGWKDADIYIYEAEIFGDK